MIELLLADKCIECNKCVEICPTDVFEQVAGAAPIIARQEDCTSCMNCELYCPVDAIYVSPIKDPEINFDPAAVIASGLIGSYRRAMHWENGRAPQGTGDNYLVQLYERQGEKRPPAEDKIRTMLYEIRGRNLI